jgi:curli production assembly/transport component CsgF
LQSRLLSALSSQIVDAIFGENPQERGTISFGGQTIDFVRNLTEVTLNITDNGTGEVTTIVIPTFIEVN